MKLYDVVVPVLVDGQRGVKELKYKPLGEGKTIAEAKELRKGVKGAQIRLSKPPSGSPQIAAEERGDLGGEQAAEQVVMTDNADLESVDGKAG